MQHCCVVNIMYLDGIKEGANMNDMSLSPESCNRVYTTLSTYILYTITIKETVKKTYYVILYTFRLTIICNTCVIHVQRCDNGLAKN